MHPLRGLEPTALEAVGCEWRYTLLVVYARNDDDDCIGSTFGKLSRVLSRIRKIFIEIFNNKNFTELFNVRKFCEILHYSLLIRILERSNCTYGPCLSSVS